MARGRPKVPGKSIYVRLDPDVGEKLVLYVEQQKQGPSKITQNSVINFAVKQFLESEGMFEGDREV